MGLPGKMAASFTSVGSGVCAEREKKELKELCPHVRWKSGIPNVHPRRLCVSALRSVLLRFESVLSRRRRCMMYAAKVSEEDLR